MDWYIRLVRHKTYEKKQANNYCVKHGIQQDGGIDASEKMRQKK